jgi:GNAT superfamily N-acetyltransferase
MMKEEETLFLVAERDARLVGQAELYPRKDEGENPVVVAHRYAHSQSLMVTAAARGQGIGKQILKATEAWAEGRS